LDSFTEVQEQFPWNIESSQQASDFDLSQQQFIESQQQQQFIPIEPSKQKEEQLIEFKPAQQQQSLVDVGVRRFNDESHLKNQTLETSGKNKNKDWKDKCVRQDDGMYVCDDSTLQALDYE